MPCPIVYICRSVCSSAIPCVPGTPIYRPVHNAGQFDSKLPSCALESSCIQIAVICWLVCCSAVVSTSRNCTNDQLVFQRCSTSGAFPRPGSRLASPFLSHFVLFVETKTYQYNGSYRTLISKLCVNSVWPYPPIEVAVEFTSVACAALSLATLSALALAFGSCVSTSPKFTFSIPTEPSFCNGRGTVSHPAGAFHCSLNCHLV